MRKPVFVSHIWSALIAAACVPALATAQPLVERAVPIEAAPSALSPKLLSASGDVQVVVRLRDVPLAIANGANSHRIGGRLTSDQQRAYVAQLRAGQNAVMAQVAGLGGRELGRVTKAYNALIVSIEASRVPALLGIAGVASVRPLMNFELTLSETVPYVGATALQAAGLTGAGIRVAVIDSGIDYTHRNFDGPGTTAAYIAARGVDADAPENKTLDGLFPTAKVIGGFDFVGEKWVAGLPLEPDPDPIDNPGIGHGTHVADIIGGHSLDGTHKGVAPDVKLYAVKVCSAVNTNCSGVAMLQGIDFALDPNGDDDMSDAVDVFNMSVGSDYGQREDDATQAVQNATLAGVVAVLSAGNAADRPYIVGSPSVAPGAISVAQTQVPSAFGVPLTVLEPASIAGNYTNTNTVSWAPVGTGWTNQQTVFVGRGCVADATLGLTEDDPYLADPAGKVALIDRGLCAASVKVDRAARAGAVGVIIGNNVAGVDAPSFSQGAGTLFVPTLVVTQATRNTIKARLDAGQIVRTTATEANKLPLSMSMAGTSSRGPGDSYNAIKPDIGAPGASVSAQSGSGNGESAFSGTSGASPMVAGAAALLLQAFPDRTPAEIKAMLMETAETNILINPATQPGVLSPVTRIGGGELRVDRAAATTVIAWDAQDPGAVSLSFGTHRLTGMTRLSKKVVVRNYDALPQTLAIANQFRYANDATNGAVTFTFPPSITVPANGSATFVVTMTINSALLPVWTLNGGNSGGTGALLQGVEYDGYLTLTSEDGSIHVPWHVLPHKANNLTPSTTSLSLGGTGTGTLSFSNPGGAVAGDLELFSLTGTSPQLSASLLPKPGANFAIVDLKAVGVRMETAGTTDILEFAVTTWGERASPTYPAEFDIYIDVDRDGEDDFVLYNRENGAAGSSGQNVAELLNLKTGTSVIRYATISDFNSANVILLAQRADLGLAVGQTFSFRVNAGDNYFTGDITDVIGSMTYTISKPRFVTDEIFLSVAPNTTESVTVTHLPANDSASPSQLGILAMYYDGKKGREADAITVVP